MPKWKDPADRWAVLSKEEPPKLWKCCMCYKESIWTKGWSWCYGFNPNLGHGVTCSDECEDRWLGQFR